MKLHVKRSLFERTEKVTIEKVISKIYELRLTNKKTFEQNLARIKEYKYKGIITYGKPEDEENLNGKIYLYEDDKNYYVLGLYVSDSNVITQEASSPQRKKRKN